jgi:hypothetical protein
MFFQIVALEKKAGVDSFKDGQNTEFGLKHVVLYLPGTCLNIGYVSVFKSEPSISVRKCSRAAICVVSPRGYSM